MSELNDQLKQLIRNSQKVQRICSAYDLQTPKEQVHPTTRKQLDDLILSMQGTLLEMKDYLQTQKFLKMQKHYTVREVSEMMKVTEGTVRNMISQKRLQSVKFGGRTLISESSLKECLHKAENENE